MVGRLAPCELGRDKQKRYHRFLDWVTDAEAKMKLLNMTGSDKKVSFMRSSAGSELITFWDKEARIRWEPTDQEAKHGYEEVVEESKKSLLKYLIGTGRSTNLCTFPRQIRPLWSFWEWSKIRPRFAG